MKEAAHYAVPLPGVIWTQSAIARFDALPHGLGDDASTTMVRKTIRRVVSDVSHLSIVVDALNEHSDWTRYTLDTGLATTCDGIEFVLRKKIGLRIHVRLPLLDEVTARIVMTGR